MKQIAYFLLVDSTLIKLKKELYSKIMFIYGAAFMRFHEISVPFCKNPNTYCLYTLFDKILAEWEFLTRAKNVCCLKVNKGGAVNIDKILLLFLFTLLQNPLLAQSPWASSVYTHQFGTGQTIGQNAPYFPNNVLGCVNNNVSNTSPASTPDEVVSLGRNGWVSVGFDSPIIDGQGADFTVFENAFDIAGGLGVFDEWLIVSVSDDGLTWLTFPYDTLTGAGMAGKTPTNGGNINYADPMQSGGDGFDLAVLGLTQIRYVRVQDATKYQHSPDKISAELDAIIAIHSQTTAVLPFISPKYDLYVAEKNLYISTEIPLSIDFYTIEGKCIEKMSLFSAEKKEISLAYLPKGLYIIWVNGEKSYRFIL